VAVEVGAAAPDFTLPSVAGGGSDHEERRDVTLSELRGAPVVLVFYPGDNTPVCTRQLNTYTTDMAEFDAVGAQVLAISPQSIDSHSGFACKQGGFAFPLLADEDKAVGAAYGVLGPLGFYRRSTFVIDASGVVTYAHRSIAGLTFRPVSELTAAVRAALPEA
jgi:peroxiredoxin Q/BCP